MDEPGEYVPQPGDSAQRLAELGASKPRMVKPGEVKADWIGAARWLAKDGAGSRDKIQQIYQPHVAAAGHVMRSADDQAALALARQAADDTREPIILARVRSGELLIATQTAFDEVAEAYGAETILVVESASPGTSDWLTTRQAIERISNRRARDVLSAAIISAYEMPEIARELIVNEVSFRLTRLLAGDATGSVPLPPGWRYHEELMPEVAEVLQRIRSEEGSTDP